MSFAEHASSFLLEGGPHLSLKLLDGNGMMCDDQRVKASMPVMALPTIRAWMSLVPS